MGLADWLGALFPHRRVTDSQISILTESQPLRDLTPDGSVQLGSARPVLQDSLLSSLQAEFNQLVARVGGKEKFLFVGDAEVAGKTSRGDIFHELSRGLFGYEGTEANPPLIPEREGESQRASEKSDSGPMTLTLPPANKSRAFQSPAILVVFKLSALKEKTNEVTIREILRDVRSRSKEAAPAIVGVVYCEEDVSEQEEQDSCHRLSHFLQEIFHTESSLRPPISICLYAKSKPFSILGVRSCVWEALRDTLAGSQSCPAESRNWRELDTDPEEAFWDLVDQIGGKESFLLVGMLCPSFETPNKVKLFQEFARELFDDKRRSMEGITCSHSRKGDNAPLHQLKTAAQGGGLKSCTQLEKPQTFSFPVILAVFKLQFIKEKANKVLIREILKDVRGRCKGISTATVGIVYSEEQTTEEEQQASLSRLSGYLKDTFRIGAGNSCTHLAYVCFYLKSRPESILGVMKCICEVLRHQDIK